MFKRVGATIVTIVMLLSMASALSSALPAPNPMELVVETVDEQGTVTNGVVAPGSNVNVRVKVKNPVALSGFAVLGTFDEELFDFDPANVVVSNFNVGGVEMNGVAEAAQTAPLGAAWFAAENVLLEDEAILLSFPLTVKSSATSGEVAVSFKFITDAMYVKDNGAAVVLPAAAYSNEAADALIYVMDSNAPYLSASANKAKAGIGELFTVTVKVNNYADNWSTMSIKSKFNSDVLELKDVEAAEFTNEAFETEPVIDDEKAGEVDVCWLNAEVVEKDPTFTALVLTFEVLAEGDADLSFSFIEGGIFMGRDDDGKDIAASVGQYDFTPATVEIELSASASLPYLSATADKDEAAIGETFTVTVKVNNYKGNWSTMSIKSKFNSDVLELKDIEAAEFTNAANPTTPVIDDEKAGEADVCWVNTAAVAKDEAFTALELTFEVIGVGDAELSFSFIENGIVVIDPQGNADFATEDDYNAEEATEEIILKAAPDKTYLSAVADKDEAAIGETFTVTVKVNEYRNNWSTMSIKSKFNSDVLELKDIEAAEFTNAANPTTPVIDDEKAGEADVCWVNTAAVAKDETFTALELTFEVIGVGDAELAFSFIEDGIVVIDPQGNADYATADDYSAEEATAEITVIAAAEKPYLSAVADKDEAAIGETFTVTVKVNEYRNNWSTMSIKSKFNSDVLELKDIEAAEFTNAANPTTPVIDDEKAGEADVCWVNTAAVAKDETFTALELTFEVIGVGDAELAFSFIEDGIIVIDPQGNADYATADDYSAEEATAEITVIAAAEKPYLSATADKDEAAIGETFTVTVKVNEYRNNWSTMSIKSKFNSDVLELKDIVAAEFTNANDPTTPTIDDEKAGEVDVCWVNTEAVTKSATFTALELTFEVIGVGDAELAFSFIEDGIIVIDPQGNPNYATEDDYNAEEATAEITLIGSLTKPYLTVDTSNVTQVDEGDEITVNLKLNDYNGSWAAFGAQLLYDNTLFEIVNAETDVVAGTFGSSTPTVVVKDNEGKVNIAWIPQGIGNVSADATVPVLSVTFKAISSGNAEFDAALLEAWTYNETAGEAVKVDADQYIAEVEAVEVEVLDVNKAYLEIDTNQVTQIVEGETVTVDLILNNYEKNWVGFAAQLLYDKDKLTIVNASADVVGKNFGTVPPTVEVKADEGKINLAWLLASANGNIDADATSTLLTVTFKAIATGDAEFNASLLEVETHNATTGQPEEVPANKYEATAQSVTVTVVEPACRHDYSGNPIHKDGTDKHVYTCKNGCGIPKEEDCTYTKQKVDVTCLEDGYTIYTCTVCGDKSNREIVMAPGEHGASTLHYFAPNKTTNGAITTICDLCNEFTGERHQVLKKGHPFPDVQEPKSWYYDAVNFSKAFGIFAGDDRGNFNPSQNITRGQLVTVLGRIMMAEAEKDMTKAEFDAFLKKQTSKVEGMKSTSGFTDISGKYYERYAKLFAKWGIINGYDDGTFKGDNNITRQEMATLLIRFIEAYRGSTDNLKFGDAATFKDFSKVSDWAKANVKWVGQVGLFQGDTNKNYNPKDNATRAEIAMVIYRMLPVLDGICVCKLNH